MGEVPGTSQQPSGINDFQGQTRGTISFIQYKGFQFHNVKPDPFISITNCPAKRNECFMGRPLERTVSSFTFSNLGINSIFSYGLDFVLFETEKKITNTFFPTLKKTKHDRIILKLLSKKDSGNSGFREASSI